MFSNISRKFSFTTSRQFSIYTFKRGLNSNIPQEPVIPPKYPGKITITEENIAHLERLSLVDFANVEGIRRLEEAIEFAQPIKEVNTEGIEPMYTVLDDATLFLAEDEVDPNRVSRAEILSNAKLIEEDYFVAPPGNIPLQQDPQKYEKTKK